MLAVDTNVIVRFLVGDDEEQANRTQAVIGREPILVLTTVLLEVYWVLRTGYAFQPTQIVGSLRMLAGLPQLSFDRPECVAVALDWTESGLDFADALHLSLAGECDGFLTFDRGLIKRAARVTRMSVRSP